MAVSDISSISFGDNQYNLKDPSKYEKPADGIPYNHLEASVRASLDKADSALYVVDKTLSIDGAAADAKKVGDELGELKSALRAISSTDNLFDKTASGIETGKYIKSTGELGNSGLGSVSDYIPVIPNTTLLISPVVPYTWYCNYCNKNGGKTVRETVLLTNVSELAIPDHVYYIKITFLTESINDVVVKYKNTDALAITNANEMSALKNDALKHYAKAESIDIWEQGSINAQTGASISSATTRIVSGSMLAFDGLVVPKPGHMVMAVVYDANSNYLGVYNGESIERTAVFFDTFIPLYNIPENYIVRIVLATSAGTDITPALGTNAYIVKYQLNQFLRLPIKQTNQLVNGRSHCAFPGLCYFAGKKILAYRISKSHLTPTDSDDWGGMQIDCITNGLVVSHEMFLNNSLFTGLEGEIRDAQLSVSSDGNYMILSSWTTYYVNNSRRFDNLLVCFDRDLNIVNYQVIKPTSGVQPFKFWGSPLITPTGHLLITGYNYTSDTASADNSIILWRSQEVFAGDVSTLTMYQSAIITDFNDAGECSIGYIADKLVAIFRRNTNNSIIKISDDLEGTTDFTESPDYNVGYAIHAPKLLTHSVSNKHLFFVGAKKLSSSKRTTIIGYFDIDDKTVKEVREIDNINFNFGGYCDFVVDSQDRFCIVYYSEDTSTSNENGTTGLYLRYINAREILSTLN